MTEIIAAAGLILSVLVAYLQIQKNQRAALVLQETHLKNELKLKLYERISGVLAEGNDSLSVAGTQYFSIINTMEMRLRHGFNVWPTAIATDLIRAGDAAQRGITRALRLLEQYEMVFLRFGEIRRALAESHEELLVSHSELLSSVMPFLPFLHTDTQKPVGPLMFPDESALTAIETKHRRYSDACSVLSGFMIDYEIETQNELLGSLFQRQLPSRHPADPKVRVLTRDSQAMTRRPKGRLI